jgi:hypothetical protein
MKTSLTATLVLAAAAAAAPPPDYDSLRADAAPYRAVCDAITDDSAAIQACVDASAAQGLPCRLPPRTCAFGGAEHAHVALTIPDGGGLIGSGGVGVYTSTLLLNTDGGGPCGLQTNGVIRIANGNSAKVLAGLNVKSENAGAQCLVNVSNAVKQVAGARVQDVNFYPAPESAAAVGLYLGNVVTSTFERNYFAVGFDADVIDGGKFDNAVRFRDNFFDELRAASSAHFMATLGTLTGGEFTGNVFETGPNGLDVRDGYGIEIARNWFGDLRPNSAGTWLRVSARGARVDANFLNCESKTPRQRAIVVAGRGGVVVEGNWIDGALIGIVSAGRGNVVKGNSIDYPEQIGVEISTGGAQEIGPNDIVVGGGRRATACDPAAYCR